MSKFQKKKDSNLISVAGIWNNESKAGEWYGSGSFGKDAFEGLDLEDFHANINDYSLKLFKVKAEYKKEGSPDFRLYITKKEPRSKGGGFKKSIKAEAPAVAQAPVTKLPWEE